ncbi:hypothetical protein QL285_011602 [Trifolium repens]|nr:hypothetical protein QL285_011602 [Trifolium repens]
MTFFILENTIWKSELNQSITFVLQSSFSGVVLMKRLRPRHTLATANAMKHMQDSVAGPHLNRVLKRKGVEE